MGIDIFILFILINMKLALFALLASAQALKYVDPDAPCGRISAQSRPGLVREPLTPADNLPDQWIWNDVQGVNYLTNLRNQHVP